MKISELLLEKIVYRDAVRHPGDWINTVVAINPTKSEFWSLNFRQEKNGYAETPSAAGVILQDGTVVVGTGHTLAHDEICRLAGLDINKEKFRLQIYDGHVKVEIWVPDELASSSDSIQDKIAAAEQHERMSIKQIKQEVSTITSRFVPGWKVVCLIWIEDGGAIEV